MSKRGQVFILAAILMAVILFSLAAIRNKSEQRQIRGDFEALSENYKIEASKLINSAIKQPGVDPHEAFKSFSTMFTSYAKGKNPEYGLIYILSFEDKIQVTNFLDREITIQGCGVGGAEYSVNISGGFDRINATLKFEEFDIKVDMVPTGLEFDCENITISTLSTEPHKVSNNIPCAFLYPEGGVIETELAVVIDGAPYKSCIKKGVPEIMQVGIMKQGEQAKVSATGSCISEDFCEGLNTITKCGTCGKNVCFWWPTPAECGGGGSCLSKYSYPTRNPGEGGTCSATCDTFCVGDRIFYKDTCNNPIVIAPDIDGTSGNCESKTKVCRNAQCCTKQASKKCCGDDLCWFNDCNPPTPESTEDCGTGESCRDNTFSGYTGGNQPDCCKLDSETRCDGNSIYYYSICGTKEEPPVKDCTSGDFDVCRDKDDGLPEARCCIENYEQKCYDEDIYNFDSCGIIGISAENCKGNNKACRDNNFPGYTGGDEPDCCKLNDEKKCYDNDVYWYSDCGTKEFFKDCGTAGCADGACVTVIYKQFKCQKSQTFYKALRYYECDNQPERDDHCRDLTGNQEATCSTYRIHGDGDCTVVCVYPEWTTECFESSPCATTLDNRPCPS